MTRNNLTGFIISALIHAGLFSLAMAVNTKPIKTPEPLNTVALTVSLFKEEITKIKEKTTLTPSKVAPIIKPEKPINIASLSKPEPKTNIKPRPKPTIVKAKPKQVVSKRPTVVKKKRLKKSVKKVVRQKSFKKPKQRKIVKRPLIKKPKKLALKTPTKKVIRAPIKIQRRPPVPVKKVTIARAKVRPAPRRKSAPVKRIVRPNKHPVVKRAIPQRPKVIARKPYKAPSKPVINTAQQSAKSANLSRQYKAKLQQLIASKKPYPKRARRRGHQGQVTLRFTVTHSGHISNISVIKGAGDNDLNLAAVKAIQQASGKLRYPNGMTKKSLTLSITLSYVLS